jgi:hypothetical protein
MKFPLLQLITVVTTFEAPEAFSSWASDEKLIPFSKKMKIKRCFFGIDPRYGTFKNFVCGNIK